MNMIDIIFLFDVIFVSVVAILKTEKIFDNGIFLGLIFSAIGLALGFGISFLFCAGVLWVIIGILSFFGVASVGAWTVGFSWTAVKVVMIIMSLITFIKKS